MLCAAFALFLTGPGLAQTAPAGEDLFTETLDVTAVDVEVVVTDKKGNPVPGLKAADFRLLVDGKPAAIEYFAEVRDGAVPAAPPPAEPGAAPVPVPEETAPGQEVPRSYLVFIDEYFTPPTMRNEALHGLAREISTLRPVDRMAVVAFNGRKLKILAPWTSPGESLQKMLETLAKERASLAASPFSIADLEPSANQLIEQYSNALDSAGASGSLINGSATEMLMADLVNRSIDAASYTLRGFAAVPGRKLLVLLSGGWAYDLRVKKKTLDQRERLRPLIDTCNLLGYTVYPIHLAQGGANLPSAGGRAISASAGIGPVTGGTGSPTQNSLIATAEETGGKMLLPGRNRHLSRIIEDTRSYYWLGLTHAGDQRRHDLKVEITRPGLQVRSRSSFLPLARPARTAMDMERALLTGDTSGLRDLDVTVGALEPKGKDIAEVAVSLRIPAADLTFAQREGRTFTRLELRTAALDSDGQRSDVPLIPIDIERGEAPGPGSFIRYDTRVQVRRMSQDLLLLVYDTLGGKSFAKKVRLTP
jgi:VWFA-related protein